MGTLPPSWPMVRPVLPRASFPGALTECDCHPACDKFHRRFSCISSVLFLQRRLFLPTLAAETQQELVQAGKKSSCDVKPGVFSASMAALLRPRHAVWGLPLSGKGHRVSEEHSAAACGFFVLWVQGRLSGGECADGSLSPILSFFLVTGFPEY